MKTKKEKIHFIGIAGSATAPLAIAMKKDGYEVSGSDMVFWDPALSLLKKNNIDFYEGTKPEKIKAVDLVIIGGSILMKNEQNPEFVEAKRLGKQIESFTYLIDKHIVKQESIVVCGTYGKTTITTLIAWILETANLNPSFFAGGLPLNFETGIRKTDSKYSVIEGDEYAATFGFNMEPKFIYYSPKHTIITAAKWDHLDVYPTEKEYIDAYKKLVKLVQKNNGQIFLSQTGENNKEIIEEYSNKKYWYGLNSGDFVVKNVVFKERSTCFTVLKNSEKIGDFETKLIGLHNVENCLSAIALTSELGIEVEKIREGIKTYEGVKRRLEIIGKNIKGAIVLDDFAHSPIKAQATLEAIRTRYRNHKVITIYQPRISERESKEALKWYTDTFKETDHVIIPKITVKKTMDKSLRIHGLDIINSINKDENQKHYFPKEEQILKFLKENSDENTIIIFMSAGGWGNLMEKAVEV